MGRDTVRILLSSLVMLLGAFALTGPAQADPRFAQAAEMADSYDRDGAITLLEPLCEEGVDGSCLRLLSIYSKSYDDAVEVKARKLAVAMCDDGGDALACLEAADMAEDGDGGDIDQPLQRRMLEKACQGGMFSACTGFAYLAGNGTGGPQDEDAARKAVESACASGDAESCLWSGDKARERYWQDSDGSDADKQVHHVEARRLFKRSCDLGNANGCARLAKMLIEGEGGDPDLQQANGLLKQGCLQYEHICNDYLELQYRLP